MTSGLLALLIAVSTYAKAGLASSVYCSVLRCRKICTLASLSRSRTVSSLVTFQAMPVQSSNNAKSFTTFRSFGLSSVTQWFEKAVRVRKKDEDKSKEFLLDASAKLYVQCSNEVDYLKFIKTYQLPDTFMSLLLLRLSNEPTILEIVKKEIIGCLWDDVKLRIKVLSKVDPACSLKKRETLSLCYGLLITSFLEYDEGILSDDKTLAGALWRNIYDRELDNPIPLNALVRYVRSQVKLLHSIPVERILCLGVEIWRISDFS
ncbi:Ubiquinol-cytochrome c reductase complex chaperone CBP3 -like protein [Trichinella nelsoni]|uniref:Ubiquinol-cytochrome c reductase complex chaperone CBP3-like protein n=1 Tax=Trichinella nelsoni TaxID=6336 RepID=A0A0V0RQ07_9BILA|nr:Ubiquinol-cytochrome c reductase complex chaperone CBP3 -like protein [Trichinella nelsoni]